MSINNSRIDKANMQVFWGEISPCDHIVQIYEDDDSSIDLLNGLNHFVFFVPIQKVASPRMQMSQ